jgi:hypothetical protein
MQATTTFTPAQDADIRAVLDDAAASGKLAFLIVYGSVSRGEERADSDLDVYYETRDEAVELEETDPDAQAHVFGARSGALLESLRRGDEMAFAIVSDAVVVYDDGTFRSVVAAARRERLEPVAQ